MHYRPIHTMYSAQNQLECNIIIKENGLDHLVEVLRLNQLAFDEDRLINRMDHPSILFLTAHCEGQFAGFKIGYGLDRNTFYSAKGAISPLFRRRGIATRLLFAMMSKALKMGFKDIQFDTFPSKYPGMTTLGLKNGFQIKNRTWNQEYNDYQVCLSRPIK